MSCWISSRRRRFVQNGDRALLDQALEQFPGVGIAIGGSIVEFVHAVRAGQIRKFDTDRRMLMLLWIAAEACEPCIVLAHLLGPHPHHGLRHGVGSAQSGEIGDGLVDRRCVQIALAGDARVAAFLTFGRLLQDDDLGAQIVGGDRSGHARGPETDDNDIGFDVPLCGIEGWCSVTYSRWDVFGGFRPERSLIRIEGEARRCTPRTW